MDRTERWLRLITLLRRSAHPLNRQDIFAAHPAYADERTKLESRARTFERDKAGLREMGWPLEVARDDNGEELGYRLAHAMAPSLRCSHSDRLLLAAAADSLVSVPGMPLRAAALNALAKLLEQPVAEEVAKRSDAQLERVLKVLESGCSLSFQYRTREAKRSRKVELDDALLELRGSYWYLTGFDRQRRGDRSFRLDRMSAGLKAIAGGKGKRSQPPWSHWHRVDGAPICVELRRGPLASPLPGGLMVVSEDASGAVVRCSNRLALMRWLCAGAGWSVLSPEPFKASLLERLDRLRS
ncbi:MAG: WYL domain-containing protein [Myxococcota bacterium]|nr:WYL domain-containing protein [Myxococcota bacterium]